MYFDGNWGGHKTLHIICNFPLMISKEPFYFKVIPRHIYLRNSFLYTIYRINIH